MDNPEINKHGDKKWYQHGQLHRDDGPAIEFVHGLKFWWLHGTFMTFDEWLDAVDMSTEDKVMMKLQYG
jgi:hypothetical protein